MYARDLKTFRPKIFAHQRTKLGVVINNKDSFHRLILVAALGGKQ